MNTSFASPVAVAEVQKAFMARVHGWMAGGLALTGLFAMLVVNSPVLQRIILGNPIVFFGLIIGELVLVIGLSASMNRLSATGAAAGFLIYSALTGLTLSAIFLIYTSTSISTTFLVTAGTFGIVSVYGYTTKADLSSLGGLCMMGLIGVILASIVNFFLRSEAFYWMITYIGIFVFVGLTAYDTQKLKAMAAQLGGDSEQSKKVAIFGALKLYLDFINLFLLLLRLLGRRR